MKLTRIFDILTVQVEKNPIKKCLSMKKNGEWEATSTHEFLNKANQISSAFLELGVKPQDKIALIKMSFKELEGKELVNSFKDLIVSEKKDECTKKE